jgi:hypothetical protein
MEESKSKKLIKLMKNEQGGPGPGPGPGAGKGIGPQGSVATLGRIPQGFLTKRRKKRLAKGE